MRRSWTFGQKVGAGFAAMILMLVVISAVAIYSLRATVASKDRIIDVNATSLERVREVELRVEVRGAASRGYFVTGDDRFLAELEEAERALARVLQELSARTDGDTAPLINEITRTAGVHAMAVDETVQLKRGDASFEEIGRALRESVLPRREALDVAVDAYVSHERRVLEAAKASSTAAADRAVTLVVVIAAIAAAFALLVAVSITRALGRQIGETVARVQSSAAELQAAATQQATASREQATAMTEITTTISELLATSRQIAESARRVAKIADETSTTARNGDSTSQRASTSIGGIRRQVDLVVTHMLELGKKSQQIGAVLEIVAELAEQTNILAINATIEAAGAGEAGKRFGVVADEIRKLADRVGGSAKEIRRLIEDVRGAVNTTVMATETGSKAVDAGGRQFDDVASSLKNITQLTSTTTEASREIELSTQQQATAVEQVNVAIANVAQTSKESEVSSSQTLQTAAQLTTLSTELLRLVRADAA